MAGVPSPLDYLLIAFGLATAVLAILVIYGNALSTREEDQLYLNRAEQAIMATEQQTLIAKMNRLRNVIVVLAVLAGVLAVASAGVWVYIGLTR
jgi:predicted ABC-type transport system involved in lysophospholipase L1 biosynthesis ATPase subunit